MLIAIDIGNSHTVIGLFTEDSLLHSWRIQTQRKATADEIASTLFGLFAAQNCQSAEITGAIVASVVPQLKSSWRTYLATLVSEPVIVDSTMDTGMPVRIDNPKEVGADRIVNSIAGFQRYARSLIIVDFGTAITFDCVSDKGEYLGGAITPGVAISLEALGQQTAKLPRVDINTPPSAAIGKSTESAIQSGILYGYGGLVDGLIQRLKTEFSSSPLVIATGGMAQLIAPYTAHIEKVEPMLTLEGLKLLYERLNAS